MMKPADLKINLINSYLDLLKTLNPKIKLELIERLSRSLKGPKKKPNKSVNDLYGQFISKKPADDIIQEIKISRNFSSTREQF